MLNATPTPMSYLRNVAIVGGSGQVGSHIVESLLASGRFVITAITRDESSSSFATSVKVLRGNYNSAEFFISALQGQDVLIIVPAGTAPKDLQSRIIEAAAQASVSWILPYEFGPDTGNPANADSLPILSAKKI